MTGNAVLQVLARPATGRRVARLFRAADAVRDGRSRHRHGDGRCASPRTGRARHGPCRCPRRAPHPHQGDGAAVRGGGPLRGGSAICAASRRNLARPGPWRRFSIRRLHRPKLLHPAQPAAPAHVLERRHLSHGDLLSVVELAAIAHLPTDRAIPGLARAAARSVAPPPASYQRSIGVSETGDGRGRARRRRRSLPPARHRRHRVGQIDAARQPRARRCDRGRGVVVIDPKGDLVTDILDRLEAAAQRLVLLDGRGARRPATQRAPGFRR